MQVLRLDPARPDREALREATEAILRGGVIAFPTDTIYGLGCSLFDVAAVEMVARLKRRDPSLAFISLIPEPGQVHALASEVGEEATRLLEAFWPGPLSLIFKAAALVPSKVRGAGGTIALRCPKDVLCSALLEQIGGPVVSSSANLSGQRPAETADEVVAVFGNQLDLVLDGGPRRGGVASTLVDVSGPHARLLRRGALDVTSVLPGIEDATGGG